VLAVVREALLPELYQVRLCAVAMFFFLHNYYADGKPLSSTDRETVATLVCGSSRGLLFVPQVHIGSLAAHALELALVVGNVFSYAVRSKWRAVLKLRRREVKMAPGIFDFVFKPRQETGVFADGIWNAGT